MKTYPRKARNRKGSAILSATIVLLSVSMVLAVAASSSLQRSHVARTLGNRARAQALAEAGVADAYSTLLTNWGAGTNALAFPQKSFAGGTYDAEVMVHDPHWAVITSTGRYDGVEQVVALDVKLEETSTDVPDSPAFGYAIVVKKTITWTGNSSFPNGGSVHSDGAYGISGSGWMNSTNVTSSTKVSTSGNGCRLQGNAAAPSIVDPKNRITGAKTIRTVSNVEIPNIDLTPYYNHALANGQVYSGKVTVNSTLTVPGGVMWVDGDLTLSGNGTYTGCFIATGNITLVGGGVHVQVNGYPAFVCRDGSISMGGNGSYQGLVYTRIGDVDITGTGTLTGSILCGGALKKAGNSGVIAYVKSVPKVPGTSASAGRVYAMAWQR